MIRYREEVAAEEKRNQQHIECINGYLARVNRMKWVKWGVSAAAMLVFVMVVASWKRLRK